MIRVARLCASFEIFQLTKRGQRCNCCRATPSRKLASAELMRTANSNESVAYKAHCMIIRKKRERGKRKSIEINDKIWNRFLFRINSCKYFAFDSDVISRLRNWEDHVCFCYFSSLRFSCEIRKTTVINVFIFIIRKNSACHGLFLCAFRKD